MTATSLSVSHSFTPPAYICKHPRPARAGFRAAALTAALAALAGPAWAQTTYDSVGAYTYTVPANAIAIDVQVVGGEGGDGGSATKDDLPGIPGGQGALGQMVKARIAVTPGEQVAVLVGGGGDGGQSSSTQVGRGTGGQGGGGVNPAASDLAAGGAGGVRVGLFDWASGGGKGGTVSGGDGQDGHASFPLFGSLVIGAGGGGGGGRGGGGGGGGMGQTGQEGPGENDWASGSGGGGGGGSSHVSIGGTRLRAAGGGGGGGSYFFRANFNVPGDNAAQPDQDYFYTSVAACATSDGGQAGSVGLASYAFAPGGGQADGRGGGGGGGGGGGYYGGSGGDAGWNRFTNPSPARGGGRAQGCSSSAAPHTLTNFGLTVGVDEQGRLEEDRPAGSGRAGKVVITPVFAQAATHPITTTASPAEGGAVNCTANPVPNGATSICTAVASAGWHLTGISGCGGAAGTTSPFTTGAVTAACTVTAAFERDAAPTIPITAAATPPEGGSVACDPNPVNAGATATCTATPTAGWHLSGISGCNGTAGTASPYTTGAITDACTVTATFARDGATPGASAHVTAVPTLGEWALMLTGLLAAGLGLRRLRRG